VEFCESHKLCPVNVFFFGRPSTVNVGADRPSGRLDEGPIQLTASSTDAWIAFLSLSRGREKQFCVWNAADRFPRSVLRVMMIPSTGELMLGVSNLILRIVQGASPDRT